MKDEPINIQPVPDSSGARVRTQFRVPVLAEGENIFIFGETRYPVIEISLEGISIRVRGELSYNEEEVLKNCRVLIGKNEFSGLKGKIVHCSFDAEGYWRCGIHWLEIDTHTKTQMKGILGQMKALALKQNDRVITAKEER